MIAWSVPSKHIPPNINNNDLVKSYLPTSSVGKLFVKNKVNEKNKITPPTLSKRTLRLLLTNLSFKNIMSLFFINFKFYISS